MNGITKAQKQYIASQYKYAEQFTEHLNAQIGIIRAMLDDPGTEKVELSAFVQEMLNDAGTVVSALEAIQEQLGKE